MRRGQLPEAEAARPVAWLAETARLRSIIKRASLGPEENGRRPLLSFAQMVATEHVRSGSSVPAANLLWVNTSSQCTQITRSLFQAGWRPFASGVPTPVIILLRSVIGPWATPDCEPPCKSGMLTAPFGAHFTPFHLQTRPHIADQLPDAQQVCSPRSRRWGGPFPGLQGPPERAQDRRGDNDPD